MNEDEPLKMIVEQAVRAVRRQVDKGCRIYIQSDFINHILWLMGPKIEELKYKCIKPVESITENTSTDPIVIFCPNDPDYVQSAVDKLKICPNASSRKILIMPIYGRLSQRVVEESGIEKQITVEELHADVFALESYMFLSPCPRCFKRVFAMGDIDDLTTISRALVKFEMLNGIFKEVHAVGQNAIRTKHIMQELKAQVGSASFSVPPTFDKIIILDRTVDIFTPLFTQTTYGGILDEALSNDCNYVNLPDGVNNPKSEAEREITVCDYDPAYAEIRGLTLEPAVDYVNQRLKDIKEAGKKMRPGIDTNTYKAAKEVVQRLTIMKPYLSLHLEIMSYLAKIKSADPKFHNTISFEFGAMQGLQNDPPEELAEKNIILDQNWDEALRLFCITSTVSRGLSTKFLFKEGLSNTIRRMLIQRFGFDILDDIEYLEKTHLLEPQTPMYDIAKKFRDLPSYEKLIKDFKLIVDPKDDTDLGAAYGGYVPLLVRVVEHISMGKIPRKLTNLLKSNRTPYDEPPKTKKTFLIGKKVTEGEKSIVRKVMVFVIGGMTQSEISLIRSLGPKKHGGSIIFYIGTTRILTGKRLINEICPTIAKLNPWTPPEPEK